MGTRANEVDDRKLLQQIADTLIETYLMDMSSTERDIASLLQGAGYLEYVDEKDCFQKAYDW